MTRSEIDEQILRLGQLKGAPMTKSGMSELKRSAELAMDAVTLTQAITEWMAENKFWPTSMELEACIVRVRERRIARTEAPRCRICDGNRFVSVDALVTYMDGTYIPKHAHYLTGMSTEEVIEVRKKCGRSQAVLSAAKPCVCNISYVGEQ